MYYAIFPGERHYHLVMPKRYRTLCGLEALKRDRGAGEYRPPARMQNEQPPPNLYRSCPDCMAASSSSRTHHS